LSESLASARQNNFKDIWRSYGIDKLLTALRPVVAMPPEQLDWLLRHHRTGSIRGKFEIQRRDAVDNLLHACGILEVGFQAGAVAVAEGSFMVELASVLRIEQVRAYYIERYPLALPSKLLLRIDVQDLQPEASYLGSWFAELLNLDATFRDGQLATFLRIVDGFHYGIVNFGHVRALARGKDALIKAITKPRADRSRAEEALAGIERFLLFCDDLLQLLTEAGDPVLEDAAFQLYRYWFVARRSALAEVVDDALTALMSSSALLSDREELPEEMALKALFLPEPRPPEGLQKRVLSEDTD
jgi:hypothetical protein